MQKTLNTINSRLDKFETILTTFNKTGELLYHLENLAENLYNSELDSELIEPITNDEDNLAGIESIISSYVSFIALNDAGLRCTPNQQILWFYRYILAHANAVNLFHISVYQLLESLGAENQTSNISFVSHKIEKNINRTLIAMTKTFERYSFHGNEYLYSTKVELTDPEEGKDLHGNLFKPIQGFS